MFIGKIEGQNAVLNVAAINRSVSGSSQSVQGENQRPVLGDRVNVSAKGKKQSLMEQLMKQKELIQESKRAAIDSAAENGTGSISQQIDEYDQQLKELDEQIAQLQAEQVEEDTKKVEEGETGIYDKPTSKDLQMETLNGITELSTASDQAEVISSVQNKIDGRVRVLESEIESGIGNMETKIEDVSELKNKSQELASVITDKLSDINDNSNVAVTEKQEEVSNSEENSVKEQVKSEDAC